MTKILLGTMVGLIAGLILPAGPREHLSRRLADIIGGMVARMPQELHGTPVLSGVLQTLEQNIEDLAHMREQPPVEDA